MDARILIALALGLSGCALNNKSPEATEPPAEVPLAEPMPAEPPPAPEPDPVLVACEALIERLDRTEPMLAGMEQSLAEHNERFDAAITALNRPAPEPRTAVCPPPRGPAIGNKEIIGAIEWLFMEPPGQQFRARIDTGADTSSLSASDIVEFERDGDTWVRFTFQHEDADDKAELELPVKRTVPVRQASSGNAERRFVVELDIRLGEQLQTTEFTLTDRRNMAYPILLGRTFLLDLYVVDVSRSYTHGRFDGS